MRGGELPVVQPSDILGVRRRGLAGDPFAGRGFPEAHSPVGEQYGDQFPVGRHGQLFGGLAKRPSAPQRQPALGVEYLHRSAATGGNHDRLTRRCANRRDRFAAGQQVERGARCRRLPPPKLGQAVAAGGQRPVVGAEGERLHNIAMCHGRAGFAIGQAGVGQARRQAAGGQVVDKNLVTPSAGSELAVRRDGHAVDRLERGRDRAPVQCLRLQRYLSLRAFVDPELDQAKLPGRELFGADLVAAGRHERFLDLPDMRHQPAFVGVARHDHRAALAALGDGRGSLEVQFAVGVPGVVAGEAVLAQDRENLGGEVDRLVPAQRSDFQSGRRLGRVKGRCGLGQASGHHRTHDRVLHNRLQETPPLPAKMKAASLPVWQAARGICPVRHRRKNRPPNSHEALTQRKKSLIWRQTEGRNHESKARQVLDVRQPQDLSQADRRRHRRGRGGQPHQDAGLRPEPGPLDRPGDRRE